MSRDDSPLVRDASPETGYTSVHRAFLQSFLTHNVMTVDEIKPVLAHIITASNPDRPYMEGDVTQPQITSTIQTLNARITPFDLEIRSTRDQHSKALTYALVNNASDALTQLATKFSPAEIAYIRRLLDCMFDTNNTPTRETMALKQNEASALARASRRNRQSQVHSADGEEAADPGISMQDAETVLEDLVNAGFLRKSQHGFYSLAPRALMELRAYLKETYNEAADDTEDGVEVMRIRDCEGCRELMTHGIRCDKRECGVRWHDQCANNFYRGKTVENRKCPKCRTVCSGKVFVGERAVTKGGSTGAGTASGRRSTQSRREEEEEDEEEDDDEGEEDEEE
ncbi:hypothetical protein P153DRAFT_373179 [Dothidotthia symphoricarpi CBS 119687]|uniref:Non-structural maintenance of chromosomes element 1 homolog n=1 Tax=Dothidotthia symphoricarpi CBS 119687 TaxID=1392245 RepID=A0A6A6APZ4_9PLEO|nr:uncharacterized protein P153DRAFT_373179 [Dothidotthia symphoricarpi CBS 119687]KAF2133606.1 hypothetical protein P153DRAFT_373179 [Dothidotthia symphoricarpi CBS 119687]